MPASAALAAPGLVVLAGVFATLLLAVTLVLAAAVAGLMAYHYAQARIRERRGFAFDPALADFGEDAEGAAEVRARSAEEIAQIRQRIEALMEQQHLQSETQNQHLAQKLDDIRTSMGHQDHKLDGLKSELRHEIRRRDAELDELRGQLSGALDAFWKAMPALPPAPSADALALPAPPEPAADAYPTDPEEMAPPSEAFVIEVATSELEPVEAPEAEAVLDEAPPVEAPQVELLSAVPYAAGLSYVAPASAEEEPSAPPEPAAAPVIEEAVVIEEATVLTEAGPSWADAATWSPPPAAAPPLPTFASLGSDAPEEPAARSAAPALPTFGSVAAYFDGPADALPEEPDVVPEGADDLTVIRGVDAELQRKLYRLGVRTLHEMARWSRADARRVSTAVGVPEETIMHEWIFEAQSVLFESYERQTARQTAARAVAV